MDLGIKGKRALVCASSKGLGLGCAQALAEAGCDLVMNARGAEALQQSAEAIRKAYRLKPSPAISLQPRARPPCLRRLVTSTSL